MWPKIGRLFNKTLPEEKPPSPKEILEEIYIVKKNLRKQAAFLDLFRKEVVEGLEKKRVTEARHFIELAEAFFYHDRSLREISNISSNQQEALEIVWQKIEALLDTEEIEVVRKVDVDFEPRLHEAMEELPEGKGRPVVRRVLQPGFIHEGKVIKPAKVMIERNNSESREQGDEKYSVRD